jgi:UDP-N-acetylmuramate--alanine ligase
VQFGKRVKEGGVLFSKFGLKRLREVTGAPKITYSATNDAAAVFATGIEIEEGGYRFDVQLPAARLSGFELRVGGIHNVENAAVAIAVAHHLQIDADKIKKAIADFKGVRRRFEYFIPLGKEVRGGYRYPVFIDDYAHHPEELKALLKSARSLFPQRKLTVIFQPHLFSRTKDFAHGFSSSLNIADTILLLPIYGARELPVEGVTSALIARGIDREKVRLLGREELLAWAFEKVWDKEFGEVLITAGAGDIDALVQPLKEILEKA